jgi:acyl carrier protein
MSVDERLREVFVDVFGIDEADVTVDSSPVTIPAWDSVAHLNLIFALEAEFGIQFEAEDIPDLVSFQVIRDKIEGSGSSAA